MTLWMFAVDGNDDDPDAKNYPLFACDECDQPIHSEGLMLWQMRNPGDQTFHRRVQKIYTVHKGRCDRRFEATHGEMLSRELDDALGHIQQNFNSPLNAWEQKEWSRAVSQSPSG